ncbi:MAG: carboxypeptidase-like regulatory domain-containing protein [Bryobacterales bacterium]|nr:carboxypeptidase-like regulatory domain-containing protein [Bryobacterales bacterium]
MNSGSLAVRLALAFLLCSTTVIWGQVTTATLYGTVQDSSGAVIPGGEATLTNDDTGLVYLAPIGATGDFVFNVLPVGSYTLKVESDGFKTYQSTGIALIASQVVRQTHTLEIGSLTETVTVEGRPPLGGAQE